MASHVLFGAHVGFAWFFALTVVSTCLTVVAYPLIRRALRRSDDPLAPLLWRLGPVLVSAGGVLLIVLPAYAALEPWHAAERAGWISIALATGGVGTLLAGVWRGVRTIRRTRDAVQTRTMGARRLPACTGPIEAFAVPERGPLVMLTGTRRPRLYVSERVLGELTEDELRVAVTHELAHHRARDNAKRQVLAFAPDLFGWTAVGNQLEREWHTRAEIAADRAATAERPSDAVHLASALVKVARLMVPPALETGCATLHDGAPIALRVSRLLRGGTRARQAAPDAWLVRGGVALALLACATAANAHRLAHQLTELLVGLP